MFYEISQVAQLRKEAELNHLDLTRGSIQPAANGGFIVRLDPPLVGVDISGLLDHVPESRHVASTVLQAEGHMLAGLLAIQRAERQRVRLGRVVGWSMVDISRKALTPEELAEYRAVLEHQRKVAQLQAELSEALQKKDRRDKAQAQVDALNERYGTRQDAPVPAVETPQEPAPAPVQAVPEVSVEALLQQSAPIYSTRKTSRKGK